MTANLAELRGHGVHIQAVVTGHFHQPFHEKLGDGELIALGDWITQFSFAVYENRSFTLTTYQATTPGDATTP